MPLTMRRSGSLFSEINNSSLLCYLNHGEIKFNRHCEEPHTLANDLMARQNQHVNKWIKILHCNAQKFDSEWLPFDTSTPPDLMPVNLNLCLGTCKSFKNTLKRMLDYSLSIKSSTCV